TLLGDTAVAVNPDDERYKDIIGKRVKLPLTDKLIPIVADSYVATDFGTGAVKITPAHDPNDREVAKRHNLPVINILNPDGTLNDEVPEAYRGLYIKKARKVVVEDLKSAGLFKEEKPITHAVGHCYRCHTVVEPYLSEQWFVKMQPLAEKALTAWKKGDIIFYPKKWENTYSYWMEHIRDWCISRQLWWGHRIPVWYCRQCNEMIVAEKDPTSCPHCNAASTELEQDPDVLDTWFSSWLWPFSTLGWPETTEDLKQFYPTSALITAYDIIFFWVSRMVMAGLEFVDTVPFRDIYIHGLVRDKKGRKMSKSLGNGIDPLEIIDEYGADAFKFTLAFMCAQGQDVLVDKESFKMGSRFANKIWNASRYILGNLEGRTIVPVAEDDLSELDQWIYARLNATAEIAQNALEQYRYNEGAQALYEFFWNDFCDWYVEGTKLSFRTDDDAEKDRAISVLLHVLEESLRLLHPYVSFVTEEIYAQLPRKEMGCHMDMLINAPYPTAQKNRENAVVEKRFSVLQDLIRSLRALRVECSIAPDLKLDIALLITENSAAEVCKEKIDFIKLLAGIKDITFVSEKPAKAIGAVGEGFEAFILINTGIDTKQLHAHFSKEIEKEQALADKLTAKLSGKFAENAPPEIVEAEKEKHRACMRRIEKLSVYVNGLSL
ncbi:MAG: valine--tRNA ligase, partial [Spirochaetales bacterium]